MPCGWGRVLCRQVAIRCPVVSVFSKDTIGVTLCLAHGDKHFSKLGHRLWPRLPDLTVGQGRRVCPSARTDRRGLLFVGG